MIEGAGLVAVEYGPVTDTFAGAGAEEKARSFGTYGYPIRANKPRTEPGPRAAGTMTSRPPPGPGSAS